MTKKSAPTKRTGRKATAKGAAKTRTLSNLQQLLKLKAIDPDAVRNLDSEGHRRIESLTKAEVKAMASGHSKVSPRKRFRPDPDGSIF